MQIVSFHKIKNSARAHFLGVALLGTLFSRPKIPEISKTGTNGTEVFLSTKYRLIVAPRKFDVLKTNMSPRSEASRVNTLVFGTSNFQRVTKGQISKG